jgi:uncharacterized glyoxalase superfamily protein PhnB
MPQLKKVVPVLLVADMKRAVDWYTGVIGFTIVWRAPGDGDGENCMLNDGDVDLLLSTGSHLGDKPSLSGTLYFHMDGVEKFYERVKDRVDIVWPLETQEYGLREFGVNDPDGYTLAFAEEVRQ